MRNHQAVKIVLFGLLSAAACSTPPTQQDSTRKLPPPPQQTCPNYTFQWGVATQQQDIQTTAFPIEHNFKMLYQSQLGFLPWVHCDGSCGNCSLYNGGIPQSGDLTAHLAAVRQAVDDAIDPNYTGYAVIDYEGISPYRPAWGTPFGTAPLGEFYCPIVRQLSMDLVRAVHPDWNEQKIDEQARLDFENAARDYFTQTLIVAKRERPKAKWGYYGLPVWFYWRFDAEPRRIANRSMNDDLLPLLNLSDVLYPSVYIFYASSPTATGGDHQQPGAVNRDYVLSSIGEAKRASLNTKPVVPFSWYRYFDHSGESYSWQFLSPEDLSYELALPRDGGRADGVIIWGYEPYPFMALQTQDYLNSTMGPMISNLHSCTAPPLPPVSQ